MTMTLYVTPTSPYARMARIAAIEKGLKAQVDVVAAQTRTTDSPYYRVSPSGRVPCLVRPDQANLEDSTLICAYFDALGSGPRIVHPYETADWDYGRLETMARSYLDGLSVLAREVRRPTGEQSPTIVAHEKARAARMADEWEREIGNPLMAGELNMPQLTLICALGSAMRLADCNPYEGRPALEAWGRAMMKRPSVVATEADAPLN